MTKTNLKLENALRYIPISKDCENRIAVLRNGECIVDKDNIKISNIYRKILGFKHGLSVFQNSFMMGVIDINGNEIFDRLYTEIEIDDDVIRINEDGAWGVATFDGRIIINLQYAYIEKFKDNVAMVRNMQGDWGIISRAGFIRVYPAYKSLVRLNSNFFIAESSVGFGVINYEDKVIVPLKNSKYELSQDKVIFTDSFGNITIF